MMSRDRRTIVLCIGLLAFTASTLAVPTLYRDTIVPEGEFDQATPQAHTSLKPGPALTWGKNVHGLSHPETAAGKWQDGTLTAPLDYSNPDGDKVEIRFRIRFANTQPAPRGLLLTHCGGPGTGRTCAYAMQAQLTWDKDVEANYDFVSVDQRGVGESYAPGAQGHEDIFASGKNCFPLGRSQEAIEAALKAQQDFYKEWYKMPQWVSPKDKKNFLDFSGTADLARDINFF